MSPKCPFFKKTLSSLLRSIHGQVQTWACRELSGTSPSAPLPGLSGAYPRLAACPAGVSPAPCARSGSAVRRLRAPHPGRACRPASRRRPCIGCSVRMVTPTTWSLQSWLSSCMTSGCPPRQQGRPRCWVTSGGACGSREDREGRSLQCWCSEVSSSCLAELGC